MENRENRNPTGQDSDISKAQAGQQPAGQGQQQPAGQAGQQPEMGQQSESQTEFGQDQSSGSPDQGLQGDTLAQQRTDIEGGSGQAPETSEAESGFVGAEGQADTSSELVEDEDDFGKDGQGAPEGK
jgi:hypothetical protein